MRIEQLNKSFIFNVKDFVRIGIVKMAERYADDHATSVQQLNVLSFMAKEAIRAQHRESAQDYLIKAESMARALCANEPNNMRHVTGLAHVRHLHGDFYEQGGDSDQALRFYKLAFVGFDAANSVRGKANTKLSMGKVYTDQGDFREAHRCYVDALNLAWSDPKSEHNDIDARAHLELDRLPRQAIRTTGTQYEPLIPNHVLFRE